MKNSIITNPGRIEDYNKVLPVLEIYSCIQSEGSRAGLPTIVVRTSGCTHRCAFRDGGFCDTPYTSWSPEKGKYNFNSIIEAYDKRPDITEMMLTGGSPTMHPALVNELTHFANERGILITIETEGSHFIKTDYPIGLISISPKFSNSVPIIGTINPSGKVTTQRDIDTHNRYRLNNDAISKMLEYHTDYHFKPVCNPTEQPEAFAEIELFRVSMGIPKNKTWIMTPGDTKEELLRIYPDVINFCAENGYNFTGREHILAFGAEREK